MKLYQKIMVSVFVILAACRVLCGWFLRNQFEKSRLERAAKAVGADDCNGRLDIRRKDETGKKKIKKNFIFS